MLIYIRQNVPPPPLYFAVSSATEYRHPIQRDWISQCTIWEALFSCQAPTIACASSSAPLGLPQREWCLELCTISTSEWCFASFYTYSVEHHSILSRLSPQSIKKDTFNWVVGHANKVAGRLDFLHAPHARICPACHSEKYFFKNWAPVKVVAPLPFLLEPLTFSTAYHSVGSDS